MKSNDLCILVRELLPDLREGRLSDEAGRLIERHIEGCAECKRLYSEPKLEHEPEPEPDIELFVKKHRRRRLAVKLAAALVGCAAVFFAGVSGYMYLMTPKIKSVEVASISGMLLSGSTSQVVTVGLKAEHTYSTIEIEDLTFDLMLHEMSVSTATGESRFEFSEADGYFLSKLPIDNQAVHSPIVLVNEHDFNDTTFYGTFFADAESQCAVLIMPSREILVFPCDNPEKARELLDEFAVKFGFDTTKLLEEGEVNTQ